MPTGTEVNYDDIDITSDLHDGVDGQSTPQGSDNATNVPEGAVVTEQAQSDIKPRENTLRDQLSNAFKPQEPNDTDNKPPAEKPQLTTDSEGRYRRVDGTFASVEEIQAFTASAQTDAAPVDKILSQLPAAVAEQIKSLPAETQQFVARTMEDLNSRASRYSEYDQLESIIGPRREAWAQNGMNSVVAVNQLFALSDFASTNPGDFVLWFAENNGIDLDALLDARDAAQQQVAPEVQELRGQVQHLSQTIAQLQGQQPQPQNENLRVVEQFASEKDEGGNLKRPYLPEIMGSFAAHVTAVRNSNPTMSPDQVLAKAYENACWADANVRLKMQAEIDAQRREAARQRAEAAKRASSGIRGGPNGSGATSAMPPSGNMSLRDTIKQAFAANS